jgi:hypothetical protein
VDDRGRPVADPVIWRELTVRRVPSQWWNG